MADIHALEIEFAKNPNLEACLPLCEAYLAQKRFMEAMVVCKKGIKQAPQDARGRVMLSRIYNSQGKIPKALAELELLLKEIPGSPIGLEALGKLLLEQGRNDEGLSKLQQAVIADPNRAEARAILQQAGMAVSTAAPPPAAPMVARPVMGMPPPGAAGQTGPVPYGNAPPTAMPPNMPPRGAPPGGFYPPPLQPRGMPPPAASTGPVPAVEPLRPLEHVHDFFAPETLGFSHEASDIETAGPGRLTILGFVPKNAGSIKTTLYVAVTVLIIASVIIFIQYIRSTNTREISKKYADLKVALYEDKYVSYQDVLRKGNEILAIDNSHNLTLGALAYTSAILATDFRQADALPKAKDYLRRAMEENKEETEYRVAARALIAYAERQFDQGIADIKKIIDHGGSGPFVELEAFRLMNEVKPQDKETKIQLRRLIQSAVSQARIFNFLGWYYYQFDDYAQADKNFHSALQNVNDHARAIIGQALTDFDRGLALQQRQVEIGKAIKKVLKMPPEQLDSTVLALAHFAAAQLLQWQGKQAEADSEFATAFRFDSQSALMYYRRGTGLLNLGHAKEGIQYLRKAAAMDPNNVRYFRTLADAQIRSGDSVGAKATLNRAAQLNPNDPELKILEGDSLSAEKKYAQAIEVYKSVKKEDGGSLITRAVVGISEAMRESGKKLDAIKYLEAFLENIPSDVMQPEQAILWCELGLDYEANREKDHAERLYQQGIDTYRYEPNCHFFLCRILGRGPEAKEACKMYLTLAPRGEFADKARARAGVR
ncbi:MAG: tetratricopeptide repeat protein [Deltaproteobacteria bacterium]|nr:tetratricopeptide repeat protein [Deltaproteobacteria bacterium]